MRILSILAVLILMASPMMGEQPNTLYRASVVTLVGGGVADVVSSVGMIEINPLARGMGGRFDIRKGISLKAGVVGGILLMQKLIPGKRKFWTKVNFSVGGFWGGVAVRNVVIR